jgi:hypothetical protein
MAKVGQVSLPPIAGEMRIGMEQLPNAYLLSGRNLWASILAHGIADTLALFVVFMGWAN